MRMESPSLGRAPPSFLIVADPFADWRLMEYCKSPAM